MRLRWVERAAHIEKEKCMHGFCGGHMNERDHIEDLGVDGRILQ